MGWIDIVVIAIVAISAIIGLAKGLFESILSIFGTALSLFVAIWAGKPVAGFLNGIVDVNGFAAQLLTDWGIVQNNSVHILIWDFSLAQAAEFLTLVASIVVVFILIKLVIWLLSRLFDSATSNNSALSGLNRLLGLVFGAVKGAVFVVIGLAVASLVSQVAFGEQIRAEIEKNQITNFVYVYVDKYTEDLLQDQLQNLIGEPDAQTPVTAYVNFDNNIVLD